MGLRAPLLAALLALPLAAPLGGAAVTCEYDRGTDYVLGSILVHHVSHKCSYYDVFLDADVVDRLDRYDGYRHEPLGQGERAFTYYTQATETTFRATGRTEFEHVSWLATGSTTAEHRYLEERDAAGRAKCHGAADLRPGVVPGRVSVPRTPDYPSCPPPGLLA